MTIILGLKCKDGVVIGCDSQVGYERGVPIKRLNANKIYCLTDNFAAVGAGTVAHIEKVISELRSKLVEEELKKRSLLTEPECIDIIEGIVTALHKDYNIERSRFLGTNERDFFDPIVILAGRIGLEEGKEAYGLFLVHSNGVAEVIDDYATAGSGAAFAELLLKNLYFKDIDLETALSIASYTINEVKEIDPYCGGPTKLGFFTSEGFTELDEEKISSLSQKTQPILNLILKELLPKAIKGEINEQDIKKLLD